MSNGGEFVPTRTPGRERWAGTFFALLSTFCYGVSNVAIRCLTEYDVPPDWILFYKQTCGLLCLLPWLLFRFCQGRFQYCSKRVFFYLIIAAIFSELIGSRLQVFGYSVVGLIIAVPLIQSASLLGVAILGAYVFRDPLSRRRKIAITILISAAVILSIGKELTVQTLSPGGKSIDTGLFLLAAAGAAASGIAYSVYIILLRYSIRQHWKDENSAWLSFKFRHWIGHDHKGQSDPRFYSPFPVTLAMSTVYFIGIIIFGGFLYCNHGTAGFLTAPESAWHIVMISGFANLIGFFFQIQGLRMTSAVQAALIGVSQMLILSLIGYTFFHEAINVLVMAGLGLTVSGVLMSAKPEQHPHSVLDNAADNNVADNNAADNNAADNNATDKLRPK